MACGFNNLHTKVSIYICTYLYYKHLITSSYTRVVHCIYSEYITMVRRYGSKFHSNMTVEQATVTDKRENIIFYIMFYTRIRFTMLALQVG